MLVSENIITRFEFVQQIFICANSHSKPKASVHKHIFKYILGPYNVIHLTTTIIWLPTQSAQ